MNILNELREIVGASNVLTSELDRSGYDQDITGKFQGQSLAVVRPKTTSEVAQVVKTARKFSKKIVPLGGNTGLSGGGYPGTDGNSIILSTERMNAVREINTASRTAVVEAGVVLETLHDAVEREGLVFPLTFGAKGSCRIGGALATNAGGSNVLRYGNTRDLCLGLEVVTADGEVMNLMSQLHKNNTGYDLKNLYIGSEGTLGIVTAAVLKLFPSPSELGTALVAMASLQDALDLLHQFKDLSGDAVEAFEFMPNAYFRQFKEKFPDKPIPLEEPGAVNVLIEIGLTGNRENRAVDILEGILATGFENGTVSDATIAQNDDQRRSIWELREAALEIVQMKKPYLITDIAVPLDKVEGFLKEMDGRLARLAPGSDPVIVGHLGDGNIHYAVWLDPEGTGMNAEAANIIGNEAESVALKFGGTFSAEHGVGLYKLDSLKRWKDPVALDAMRKIKAALDPMGLLNPGKLIPLELGPD